jgi:hypothetical protein
MMNCTKTNKKLLFENQVLQARIAIRDFHSKEFTRNIYENVGQVLSRVRMQLGQAPVNIDVNDLEKSGELIAKSIVELRALKQHFLPDFEVEHADYLVPSLLFVFTSAAKQPIVQLTEIEGASEMKTGTKLIACRLVQHIFSAINNTGTNCKKIEESYHPGAFHLVISCDGASDVLRQHIYQTISFFSVADIVDLLNSTLEIYSLNNNDVNIFLKIPLNLPYE